MTINLDKINRIRAARGYTKDTLRCDMAERGIYFPESFYKKVINSISQLDFLAYPDYSLYEDLSKKIGELHGVDPSRVLLGAGSDSLLKAIIQTECLCKNKSLIIPIPSFPMVAIYAEGLGVTVVNLEINSPISFDVESIISKIDESVGLIIISDPMSPYGQELNIAQRRRLIDESGKRNITVVFDQAYGEFVEGYHPKDICKSIYDSSNVIILKTLSKAAGLAGARVGYLVSSAQNSNRLSKVIETFPISSISARVALELISQYEIVEEYSKAVCKERSLLVDTLKSLNINVLNSATNSIHFEVPVEKYSLFLGLLKKSNVLAKYGDGIGTPVRVPGSNSTNWVRFSIFPDLSKTTFFISLCRLFNVDK